MTAQKTPVRMNRKRAVAPKGTHMPFRRIPPIKWAARDEVRELARTFTVQATKKLGELIDSKSDFVAILAARAVLQRAEVDPPYRKAKTNRAAERKKLGRVRVKITRFGEGKDDAK
jgi:hypothetical protein